MHITWIRHGQTEENVKGTYYGQKEATLTLEGVRQIKALRPFVTETSTIYVSPSQRTIDTANILWGKELQAGDTPQGVKFVIDERLVERNMGKWEGLTYQEIEKENPVACKAWEEDWINFTLPEGESAKDQYDRVSSLIKMLEEKKEDAIVIAHAGTIRMALAYMLGENIDLFWKFKIETGAMVKTECEDGFWYIESITKPKLEGVENLKSVTGKVKSATNHHEPSSGIVLVTGGVRSGKSKYAESIFSDTDDVLYLATAKIIGEEMAIRVKKHREWRNPKWETHEGYRDLDKVIEQTDKGHILLDCVTIFTSNFMFEEEIPFEDRPNEEQEAVLQIVLQQMDSLMKAARKVNKKLVLVTNEVGNGIVPAYALGRIYRDYIGIINVAIAKEADEVYEIKCGLPIRLK